MTAPSDAGLEPRRRSGPTGDDRHRVRVHDGVRFEGDAPPPTHWHDRLATRFGYPRLSCQIAVDRPLAVRLLPAKIIWGRRA